MTTQLPYAWAKSQRILLRHTEQGAVLLVLSLIHI